MSAKVWAVVGLQYGDEGKGSVVDFLTRREGATWNVRFNGGAQAAHNVVLSDGRHHTFAQFGSGTFAGARTFLSSFMLVNPISMAAEAAHLTSVGIPDPWSLVYVDGRALVTTPWHIALNRLKEISRGAARHGSCGMGIGETRWDELNYGRERCLQAHHLLNKDGRLRERLREIQKDKQAMFGQRFKGAASVAESSTDEALAHRELDLLFDNHVVDYCMDAYTSFARRVRIVDDAWFYEQLALPQSIVFEGAQGVLLDEQYGFHPYTTWTKTTFANAYALLMDSKRPWRRRSLTRIGVMRAYMTRHGAGPFVTETPHADHFSAHDHNRTGDWQGQFRSGWFDWVAAKYAVDVVGPLDELVVTHMDRVGTRIPVCYAYHSPPVPGFEYDGRVQRIVPRVQENNDEVSSGLFRMTPIVTHEDHVSCEEFKQIVSGLSQRKPLPVTESWGPRAEDKKCR